MEPLKRGQVAEIVYEGASPDAGKRVILPTSVPQTIVRAIELTELSQPERDDLQKLYAEYAQYYENFMSNAYNFETWVEHSTGKAISPKWRAFKLSKIVG